MEMERYSKTIIEKYKYEEEILSFYMKDLVRV